MNRIGWKGLLALVFFFTQNGIAAAATRNIMLIGYWPPTNEMLRPFSANPHQNGGTWIGRNWNNSGYDIYAYFPEYRDSSDIIGYGDFPVDFAATYNDFQRITRRLKPVAIVAFGRGAGPWEIESVFPPNYQNYFESGVLPSKIGERVEIPIPASLTENRLRYGSLPMREIEDEVNAAPGTLRAWTDNQGAGTFLCGFLGYLTSWYQEIHADAADPAHTAAAGFIHVDGGRPEAEASLRATLRALTQDLPR